MELLPGYAFTVLVLAVAAVLGVWAPRRPRALALACFGIGMVIRELPGLAIIWLLASTGLALGEGALETWANLPSLLLAALVLICLVVIAARGFAARTAVDEALGSLEHGRAPFRSGRSWPSAARGLLFPFTVAGIKGSASRRIRGVPYGSHRRQVLDVWVPRSRRAEQKPLPLLLYFHGGGYHSGSRRRTAQELLARFSASGWVCVSADYRLRPEVGFEEHLEDARAVIAWARRHAAEFGAEPDRPVLIGSSAGAHLCSFLALTEADVAAVIGLYGYYGDYYEGCPAVTSPGEVVTEQAPPFCLIDGAHDTFVPLELGRTFAARLLAVSRNPVVHIVLPGAQHNFDLFASVRFGAVIVAVRRFLEHVGVGARRD